MKVSIKYCVPWNFLPQASSLEEELKANFTDIYVELIKGKGGVFTVKVDGKKIFSKKIIGRFPQKGEIIRLIHQME